MKNILKNIAVIWMAVSLLISVTGCSREDEAADSGSGAGERKDYIPEYVDLGGEIGDMAFHYGMQQFGDELCYLSNDQEAGQVLNKYSLTDGSRTSVSFTWPETEERYYISGFCFSADGGIYAIAYQYAGQDSQAESEADPQADLGADSKAASQTNSSPAIQLCGFDPQGKQSFAVDISEQLREETGGGISRLLATDVQGRIYIAGETKVWLYEVQEGTEPHYQGAVTVCPDEEEQISSVICGKDGRVYVCRRMGESISSDVCTLVQIDFDRCRFGAVYEDFPGAGGIAPGMEKDFLVRDDSAVYEYDLATGTMEPVLDWVENNVAGNEVRHFGMLTDGRIYAVTTDRGREDSEIVLFSRATGEEQTGQKEEITLGYFNYNSRIQKAVVDFNKSSDTYYIVLKEYEEYQRLLADITANCPDILDLNGLDVEQLAGAGVFEDLGAYLDSSQVLDRSDYLENVLETYTFDGRLVTIPACFWLQAVFAGGESLEEVFGSGFEGGWTVEELMAYAAANPETELFDRPSRQSVMDFLMKYGINNFIDREAGQCSFDSDRFRNVLEFVAGFPDDTTWSSVSTAARIEAGEVLLGVGHINRFDGLQLYQEVFGGEVVCVGFPTVDGSVGCTLHADNALAISAVSSHKEGAWAFLESFLVNEEYVDTYDFVTNKAWLEDRMETALAAEYATYDDGTPVVDPDGNKVILNYSGYTVTYSDGWTFFGHLPTEEEIREVYELIGKASTPDRTCSVILDMINEEAEAFYQGQKSVDEVADIIQRRSQLYMDENGDIL